MHAPSQSKLYMQRCVVSCDGACAPQVRAVRLRRDRIVVALEHKVLSYNFADLKLLHQIETLANSRGLLALSSAADATVLACPGLHTGQVGSSSGRSESSSMLDSTRVISRRTNSSTFCQAMSGSADCLDASSMFKHSIGWQMEQLCAMHQPGGRVL